MYGAYFYTQKYVLNIANISFKNDCSINDKLKIFKRKRM